MISPLARRRATAALLCLCAALAPAAARADAGGTVFLKSGGRIHGELIEVLPGQYVTVRITTGEIRKFAWGEVDHVDEPGAARPAPPAAQAPAAPQERSTIVVRSTKPDTQISRVTGRSFASAVGYGGTVTASGISWVDLCVAPCTVRIAPGLHELRLDGPGYTITTEHFNVQPGENKVLARPGSAPLYTGGVLLFSLGLTGVIVGGALWGVGAAVGGDSIQSITTAGEITTLISLPVMVIGIPMWIAGMSSLEVDKDPPPQARAVPHGFSLHGAF